MLAKQFTYYLVDFFCLLFPLLFSFHPKIQFYRHWKSFFLSCFAVAVFFIVWDMLYTALGVWSFNPAYTGVFRFINLPLEELLFFFCIPYACVFTYHCLNRFFPLKERPLFTKIFSLLLLVLLVAIALMNIYRIYTSVTCMLLAISLAVLLLNKVIYLLSFFRLYGLILAPFLVSNGILTGSWIDAPVVMYNDDYNLGLRIFTIPVEDVFYGMLLVLLNVSLYEWLEERKTTKTIDH